ncbi:MAG: tetratricopeptide repeat protein [Limnospira sp. PMC 1240.20]|nr:tetratricopeptide repeat protein [Limnospira sp. PMC 1256.20]MDT9220499.1 tetratricopeptide repeat protein [Limnospira sp. PMC 1240.20]MDT9256098.1 tetratricopeptide repeat protein [Limnospira sp. PMC 1254.20]MDT9261130.1 tetratricopeptide repeat protein [Limnospira sp. PMC 1236.20]MDT9281853.1 tetratricopeptide repeat protein [Limnospira sp. PMC 1293.21]
MSAGELLRQANQLKRSGKLEEAIALYHQVIDINPHFAWAYHGLGDALAKQGNLDEAVTCYSEGLKIHPNSAWLYYSLGEALAQQGDLDVAAEYLKKAIELKPSCENLHEKFRQILSSKESLFQQKKSNVTSESAIEFLMSNLSNLWDNKFLEKNCPQFLSAYQNLHLYQSGELLAEGSEAKTYKKSNVVIKEYKSRYYSFNDAFNRKGEGYYIKKYRSICFIELLQESPLFIIMPYAGEPIGIIDKNMPGKRRINLQGLDYLDLVRWLVYLQKELNRLKIKHRDINPTNILYNRHKNEYKLIDFCWALEEGEPDEVNSKPSTLNPYAENDNQAIERLTIFAIKELISQIASEGYKDGSSTQKGWVYHPVPFPEFEEIPVHKKTAANEIKEILEYSEIDFSQQPIILEIGSAIGYFSFNLAQRGAEVVAFEADTFAYRVAEALRLYKKFENIKFINQHFSQEVLTQFDKCFDLVIMLNVHMWIHKQLGESATKELMKLVAQKTKKIAFQTAHSESGGMYTIKSLKNKNDIYNYLIECGFKNVQYIRETTLHGGKRILFFGNGNI